MMIFCAFVFFFFKQKTAYEMRISDWSSDVCSSDLSLLGDVAVVETNGITLVLTSVRNQAVGCDLFTQFGIDLGQCKFIVVKSSQHFYAEFSKVAAQVIYLDTPGSVSSDINTLPYKKLVYPKWPLATPAR